MRAVVLSIVAVVAGWSPVIAADLIGIKGSELRGSISCVHPNLIHDLAGRLGNEQDYTYVLRIYIDQGYCMEWDVPTILRRPLVTQSFPTWEGYQAELWNTTLIVRRPDGSEDHADTYSIVFPREMESTYRN